jgi:hypothetical protein
LAHHKKVCGSSLRLNNRTSSSMTVEPGCNRTPCIPFIRANGSWSEHHAVPVVWSISQAVGRNVAGRWCCGQLNSTPPASQGPVKPTRAGLITEFA